jgi:DNA polymerase I-like protein with 3'-5' exonuclease and polymerase domains
MGVILPNVRKLFIPDPGFTIFDVDLSGADAQVVAWEADDSDLKKAFRSGVKIHEKNARDIYGQANYDGAAGDRSHRGSPKGRMYDACKRRVHATNYGASAYRLSQTPDIGGTISENETFQSNWFRLHPGIKRWHDKVEKTLAETRTIYNRFGYRIIYFDRLDNVFTEALAWIPQSTVAEVCFRGALQLVERCPFVQMLLQVHDSLVFQISTPLVSTENLLRVKEALLVTVPYDDPLVIPWGFSKSERSWGDCEEFKL